VKAVQTVQVRLDDGGVVELSRAAAQDLYDLMWTLAPTQGAVTTAAKLHQALKNALLGSAVELDAAETIVFSDARQRLTV